MACDLFCSALCSAYNRVGIDPHLRMEERLAKAYHCFEGAEVWLSLLVNNVKFANLLRLHSEESFSLNQFESVIQHPTYIEVLSKLE